MRSQGSSSASLPASPPTRSASALTQWRAADAATASSPTPPRADQSARLLGGEDHSSQVLARRKSITRRCVRRAQALVRHAVCSGGLLCTDTSARVGIHLSGRGRGRVKHKGIGPGLTHTNDATLTPASEAPPREAVARERGRNNTIRERAHTAWGTHHGADKDDSSARHLLCIHVLVDPLRLRRRVKCNQQGCRAPAVGDVHMQTAQSLCRQQVLQAVGSGRRFIRQTGHIRARGHKLKPVVVAHADDEAQRRHVARPADDGPSEGSSVFECSSVMTRVTEPRSFTFTAGW